MGSGLCFSLLCLLVGRHLLLPLPLQHAWQAVRGEQARTGQKLLNVCVGGGHRRRCLYAAAHGMGTGWCAVGGWLRAALSLLHTRSYVTRCRRHLLTPWLSQTQPTRKKCVETLRLSTAAQDTKQCCCCLAGTFSITGFGGCANGPAGLVAWASGGRLYRFFEVELHTQVCVGGWVCGCVGV